MKLKGPKGPVCAIDTPIIPPKATATTPTYGPTIIPINGAMMVATVINFPTAPIIGKRDQSEKMAYKGVKQQTKATFLAEVLEANTI